MMKFMSDRVNLGIGLVTHSNSRYLNSNGEHDIFNSLQENLNLSTNSVLISSINNCDLNNIDSGIKNFLYGIYIFLNSVFKTQTNIIKKSTKKNALKNFKNFLSDVYQIIIITLKYLIFRATKKNFQAYFNYAKRQADISESHIELLLRLSEVHVDWIIVLEDDAYVFDVKDATETLKVFFDNVDNVSEIKVINLSESFSDRDLGIEGLVGNKIEINNKNIKSLKIYNYPVTNTVCATAYRKSGVKQIVEELIKMNKMVFIPIDHKMNIAFYNLLKKGEFKPNLYASTEPGLLLQRSMYG